MDVLGVAVGIFDVIQTVELLFYSWSLNLASIVYLVRKHGSSGPILFIFGNAKVWKMQKLFLKTKRHEVAENLRKMLQDESSILSVSVRMPIVGVNVCSSLPRN